MVPDQNQNLLPASVFQQIRVFVFDMDGVLTDGSLLVMDRELQTSRPVWYRTMHVHDGYALQLAVKRNYRIVVLSGSASAAVHDRLKSLGIEEVFFQVSDKAKFLSDFCRRHGLSFDHILFAGDDIPDMEAMKLCAVSACPSDAVNEIRESAAFVSAYGGGKGFVRDVIRRVMKAQNTWDDDVHIASA